jgi:hypothetical protein
MIQECQFITGCARRKSQSNEFCRSLGTLGKNGETQSEMSSPGFMSLYGSFADYGTCRKNTLSSLPEIRRRNGTTFMPPRFCLAKLVLSICASIWNGPVFHWKIRFNWHSTRQLTFNILFRYGLTMNKVITPTAMLTSDWMSCREIERGKAAVIRE